MARWLPAGLPAAELAATFMASTRIQDNHSRHRPRARQRLRKEAENSSATLHYLFVNNRFFAMLVDENLSPAETVAIETHAAKFWRNLGHCNCFCFGKTAQHHGVRFTRATSSNAGFAGDRGAY
jgi:hypothetical protein